MSLDFTNFHESPFEPGIPVSPDKFKGRNEDIIKLIRYIPKVVNQGKPEHFFIIGKRGMGKTSYVNYISEIVEEEYQMVPVYVNNEGKNKIDELVQLILESLFEELNKETWGKKIVEKIVGNISEIKVPGVGISLKEKPEIITNVKNNFYNFLINISESLKDKKGLFLVIDDINGLSDTSDFVNWYKGMSETINFSKSKVPIVFTLVSYSDNFDKLTSQNPSFSRIFHLIEINHLDDKDIESFFIETFAKKGITFNDKDSINQMVYYSWGMPLIMQQIGDGVFWSLQNEFITENIALSGILNAALELGNKQIKFKLNRIKSKHYINILLKIGKNKSLSFQKSQIKKLLNEDENRVFDDFLVRMKELNIIESVGTTGSGEYSFSNRLYFVYFLIMANIKKVN